MIDFHEALGIIAGIEYRLPREQVNLKESVYRILGEDIYSDQNMPPFNKSAMDGYACRKEDLLKPLRRIETIHAGNVSSKVVEPGTCIKIMTGAPVPEGADTVIMLEHTEEIDSNHIRFVKEKTKSNICLMGEDVKKGDRLLTNRTLLLPHHIAILASAGYTDIEVYRRPRLAILSTGSELVEPEIRPSGAKIRNSNAYNLMAQFKQENINASYDGIIPDEKESITKKLRLLLEKNDIVILTGGASAGEHDFVPAIIKEVGMDLKFDRMAIQPGKPISFAYKEGKFCFGLSGNPVSSFLQCELIVKPLVYQIMGHQYCHPIQLSPLAGPIQRKKADRLKFFPVIINEAGKAEEVKFNGSAHIAGLADADGFGLFPKECYSLVTDELIEVLRIK